MGVMRSNPASQGRPVTYGVFESPLGKTMVAVTPVGVCAVAFADCAEDLLAELRSRMPGCDPREDSGAVSSFASVLLTSLSSGAALSVPLDVQGTAFQQQVWAALQAIPRGTTQTYTQVAQALGLPTTAARAVAQACAANPVAVAIPCHRVLGAKGDLRGYRWGMERKRRLLILEHAYPLVFATVLG